ncbi:MAG: zf-HC2 domain-containing protein [Planctomycetes bacterium]|nr:zf-HC2 domain-containing protein [Planctomycetota bacterium]
MSCRNVVWKIGPLVDGELPTEERREVEAHLAACKDCVEMATQFRELDALAGRVPVPPVSGEEWALIWERIGPACLAAKEEGEEEIIQLRPASRTWRWLVPAVAAAALFVLGVFVGANLGEKPSPDSQISKPRNASTLEPGGDCAERVSGPGDTLIEEDAVLIKLPNF